MSPPERITFIVRLLRDESGQLSGIVERVRTGEKEQFSEVATLGVLIARMLEHAEPEASASG